MAFASSRIGAQEAVIIPCDFCEEEEDVNWFCKDCGQNLCDRCKKMHLRGNITRNHELLSISEGIIVTRRNIPNSCDEHTEPFLFYCRTCKRNICSKCLSKNHKKHDFVDLREIQEEVQKKLTDILEQKEGELESIVQNFHSLSQYRKDFHSYIAACYASIDENVQAIKDSADTEGKKLKSRLNAIKEKQDQDIDESEKNIRRQKDTYTEKIFDIKRELRIQTSTTMPAFSQDSQSKLQTLAVNLTRIPAKIALFREGSISSNHIRDMIGSLDSESMERVLLLQKKHETDARAPILRERLKVVGSIGNESSFPTKISSMCCARDGTIWIGGRGIVFKVDVTGAVLTKTEGRGYPVRYNCNYIACLKSGDALVSYGSVEYIDRFSSDGKRICFADMSPSSTYNIAVTDENHVAVNVDEKSLILLSEHGQKLKEIKPDMKPFEAFCPMQDGGYMITNTGSSSLTIVDTNGKVTGKQKIATSKIRWVTRDCHGNVIATDDVGSVYVVSEDGKVVKKYQIPGKKIDELASDINGRLLIATAKYTITLSEYISD